MMFAWGLLLGLYVGGLFFFGWLLLVMDGWEAGSLSPAWLAWLYVAAWPITLVAIAAAGLVDLWKDRRPS